MAILSVNYPHYHLLCFNQLFNLLMTPFLGEIRDWILIKYLGGRDMLALSVLMYSCGMNYFTGAAFPQLKAGAGAEEGGCRRVSAKRADWG